MVLGFVSNGPVVHAVAVVDVVVAVFDAVVVVAVVVAVKL